MESKMFSTLAAVSLVSGRLLCSFSDMHELAEWVMGYPIWTHEFGHRPMMAQVRNALLQQHPALASYCDIDAENWRERGEEASLQLGAELLITKGASERELDPISTLVAMLN